MDTQMSAFVGGVEGVVILAGAALLLSIYRIIRRKQA